MKKLIASIALAAGLAGGCNRVTYVNPTLQPVGATAKVTGHFWINGLIGRKVIDARLICPSGVAAMQSKHTVGNVILTLVTFTLYAPRTYVFRCGGNA